MFVLLSLSVVSSTVAQVRIGLGGLLTDESKFAVESTVDLTGLTGLFDWLCPLLGLAMNCMGFVTGL